MKEIWFREDNARMLQSQFISRTFRAPALQQKNNVYVPGDVVKCRIYLAPGFSDKEYVLKITDVKDIKVGELGYMDFCNSDITSPEDLRQKFVLYYGREFSDTDIVRMIDFRYAGNGQ